MKVVNKTEKTDMVEQAKKVLRDYFASFIKDEQSKDLVFSAWVKLHTYTTWIQVVVENISNESD